MLKICIRCRTVAAVSPRKTRCFCGGKLDRYESPVPVHGMDAR